MKEITKIVLTGGPCAGKTSAQEYIRKAFEEKGYVVFFVPECATILINSGIDQKVCGGYDLFEKPVFSMQVALEKCYGETAQEVEAEKVLIVCDRGTMDIKAFIDAERFDEIAGCYETDEESELHKYDAVFHLVTAAKGAEEFYSSKNNSARIETLEEAAKNDDRIIAAWEKHPNLVIIENRGSFDDKMNDLISAIDAFLGSKNNKQ